jgi:DNA-binding GntR family transcriptional regulator
MPLAADTVALPRNLLRDDVYQRIRDAIVDGSLAPGEQLRDTEIASRLGVSRTPVREALLRLQQAGLVIAAPGRSTIVSSVDLRAVRDAQSVVAAMHALAVREAVGQLTGEDLDRMRSANRRFSAAIRAGDAEAALRADDELHDVPVAAAGNFAVRAVLEQFTPVVRRLERARFASIAGRGSVRLHAELIDLCAAGDVEAAAAASYRTWQTLAPLLDLAGGPEVADGTATDAGPQHDATQDRVTQHDAAQDRVTQHDVTQDRVTQHDATQDRVTQHDAAAKATTTSKTPRRRHATH